MTKPWRSSRALALTALLALSHGAVFSATDANANGPSPHVGRSTSRTTPRAVDGSAQPISPERLEGAGTATIQYDGFDGTGSKLSVISFRDFFKSAFGVRFTPTANQLPFTLTTVTALLATSDGTGLHPGDPIEIVVLVDAGGTGSLSRAIVVDLEATTVNEAGAYALANPVTLKQGDVYVFVVDRSTTPDGTVLFYYGTEKGAVNAHRSFIGSIAVLGDSGVTGQAVDAAGHPIPDSNDIESFDDFVADDRIPQGNFVIRIQGTTGASADATGGSEPADPSIASPTVTGLSIGSGLRLTITPAPTPVAPAPVAVAEAEPNNSIAAAQQISANARVSGSARSSDSGGPGGFCDANGAVCDDVEDYYTFTTTVPTKLAVTLSDFGASNDFDLVLFAEGANPSNPSLTGVAVSGAGAGVTERMSVDVLRPGTYYVGVSAFDPGVPAPANYKLTVATAPALTGYDVYCGAGLVTPSAASFVGAAGSNATSFTVKSLPAGAVCVVTTVVGGTQGAPTAPVAGAPCAGGPSIDGAKLKKKKLTLTSDARAFDGLTVANTRILLDGIEIESPVLTVAKKGAVLAVKGTVNGGQPLTSIGASGATVPIAILTSSGCAQGTVAVP